MKKVLDVLLVLLLVGMVGYLIYADGKDGILVGTPVPVLASPQTKPTDTFVLISNATPTLPPASVTVPTKTATPTPTPTLIPSITPMATSTPTAAPTLTVVPTQSLLDREITSGIQRGNQIINVIEMYHTEKGVYPVSLNDLIPRYMVEIPLTTNGRPYFYRPFDVTSPLASEVYWLAFRAEVQDHVTCTYMRRLDYWDCDFASP